MTKAKNEISPELLRESTLYCSAAPCMMCCMSMWYRDLKSVVYGVSYETIAKITGSRDKVVSCDKLYQEIGKPLEWIGPVLEKEGIKVFCYWPDDAFKPVLDKELEKLGIEKPCDSRTNVLLSREQ
jgi:tRNA(Arg) A34 adenosine deaminase TadA